ncbi:ubiquitin conjugating enzyme [Grosmannia clavigera kw1407]|uniref:Ubiquitin-conjugating enzyme E2 2 n=1 Tax=Grosmannia clavigera (strain kw1407 / UAMH 11150) TaxID=655863 RepID=F0XP27_GROCL|nr:ubiquitin conjugating enzyme [Grosmannia clavigera kw1407]EFX00199.1 ubiquitin conjugating enzyme [Grosmannia clavigera kw1407]
MTSTRERRIAKELHDINQDKDKSGVFAAPVDASNLTHLKGTFPAPPDTPYAGGTYTVDIQIPDMYPFKSPIIKFDTRIWHPNISSQTGAICLDTLGTGWSPVGTIKMALMSLRMLLESPNPKDPQDAEVAKMLMDDPEYFNVVAHDWAVRYAGAPRRQGPPGQFIRKKVERQPDDPARYQGYNKDLIDRFVNMGFELDAVVEAFNFVGIDRNGGEDYELEEAYMGDITARLLGEQ